MKFSNLLTVSCLGFAAITVAHPGGHEEHSEAVDLFKRSYRAHARRGLEKCSSSLESSGLRARARARRHATVELHRRGITKRDTDTVLDTSHNKTGTGITSTTDESTLFVSNNTCVLNPEGETGPYYVLGEYIRSNVRENQTGVPIILEGQFVNVETCEPITDLYWDIWNCNATGVYSGLVATGNGNTDDTSNLNATFLRGVQKTDSDGVVTFESIFPGHYSGRTTHHHMVAHLNVTVLSNNTITGGTVAHIGQLFWDQDLIEQVESTYPYNTNTIEITENADDRVFSTETENSDSDPVIEYVMLGDSLSDGLFGWVTIAVNVSATYDPNYSFVYTSSGSIAESGGTTTVDGGDGASGGNGSAPGDSGAGSGSGSIGNGTAPDGAGGLNSTGGAGVGGASPGGNGTLLVGGTSTSTGTAGKSQSTSGSSKSGTATSAGSTTSSGAVATTTSTSGALRMSTSLGGFFRLFQVGFADLLTSVICILLL